MSKITLFELYHKFVIDTRISINSKYFDFYSLTYYVSDCEFNILILHIIHPCLIVMH